MRSMSRCAKEPPRHRTADSVGSEEGWLSVVGWAGARSRQRKVLPLHHRCGGMAGGGCGVTDSLASPWSDARSNGWGRSDLLNNTHRFPPKVIAQKQWKV